MQLKVLAYWQDGTVEDVTDFTRFDTNDESVATVNDLGEVRIVGKGDSHVVAFYDNGVLPLPVMLPVSDQVGAKYPKVKANTPIDKAIATKLQKVGIVPSDLCTDQEFLRRVTLDVTGTLPTAKEVKDFLASKDSKKRQKKVNELLARPAYAAWWTTKLNDFQGNSPQQIRVSQYLPRDVNLSSDWYNWVYKRVWKINRTTRSWQASSWLLEGLIRSSHSSITPGNGTVSSGEQSQGFRRAQGHAVVLGPQHPPAGRKGDGLCL